MLLISDVSDVILCNLANASLLASNMSNVYNVQCGKLCLQHLITNMYIQTLCKNLTKFFFCYSFVMVVIFLTSSVDMVLFAFWNHLACQKMHMHIDRVGSKVVKIHKNTYRTHSKHLRWHMGHTDTALRATAECGQVNYTLGLLTHLISDFLWHQLLNFGVYLTDLHITLFSWNYLNWNQNQSYSYSVLTLFTTCASV